MSPETKPDRTAAPASGPKDGRLPGKPVASEGRAALYDYLGMLARRKWLAIALFFGVLGLTAVSIVRTPPVFQSRATFMVKSSEGGNVLAAGYAFYNPNMNLVANCLELLRSRTMAESVAARMPASMGLTAGDLMSMIAARKRGETDIVELVATGPSAASAIAVANAYLEYYRQYDLDQNRAEVSATKQFIEDQLAIAGPRLDSSERSLEQFKTTHQMVDLDGETRGLVGQQSTLSASYQQGDIDIQTSKAQLAYIQSQIDQAGEGMADRLEGISSPLISSLQGTLNQLEVAKTNLMIGGFGQTSERVRDLNRQIDSTRAQLRSASKALIAQQGFGDPIGQLSAQFEAALTIKTGLAASKARQEALAKAIAGYNAKLQRLPETERILAGLIRDAETDRTIHTLLSQRYEETRIQEAGRLPSVRLIDYAQSASQTQPDVQRGVSFGLMLALALALGSVWAAEYLDSSIHGQRELERRGYSVLGSIPQLVTTGRRWGRRTEEVTSHLITHTDVESSGAEAFRMLRTVLPLPMRSARCTRLP